MQNHVIFCLLLLLQGLSLSIILHTSPALHARLFRPSHKRVANVKVSKVVKVTVRTVHNLYTYSNTYTIMFKICSVVMVCRSER